MSGAMTLEKKASFTLEPHVFEPRHVLAWFGFTLSAGIVNAGAVLASDTVVTHITGSVTNVALDASLGAALLFVISLFIGGAMVASLVRETLRSRPRIAPVVPIALATTTLLAVTLAGHLGAFGQFGATDSASTKTYLMLGLLAASMGMLNAAVAGVTGNQVRPTSAGRRRTSPATSFVVCSEPGRGRAPSSGGPPSVSPCSACSAWARSSRLGCVALTLLPAREPVSVPDSRSQAR